MESRGEEQASSSVRCIDLLKASPADLEILKEKIRQNGGEVDVWVHPFYHTGVGGFQHRVVTDNYPEARDQLLKDELSGNKPVIFLEESTSTDRLAQNLSGYGSGEVYVVTTQGDSHVPQDGRGGWEKLVNIFKTNGVKHVTVGGMWMQIYKSEFAVANLDESAGGNLGLILEFIRKVPEYTEQFPEASKWLKKDLVPLGCAGMAVIDFLRSGIDVSISSAATPCCSNGSEVSYIQQEWSPPDLSGEI